MKMRSFAELETCAGRHLDTYMDPAGDYAFNAYDQLHDFSGQLTPLDCLAPNLLSLRLTHRDVIPLFQQNGEPPAQLRVGMQQVLDNTDTDESFADLGSIDDPAFGLVRSANKATELVRNWTPVTVSKVLHRLRPRLVPVYDSMVREFYGTKTSPPRFYSALHADMNANRELLATFVEGRVTADGRPLSELRAVDIVIWLHMRSRCDG